MKSLFLFAAFVFAIKPTKEIIKPSDLSCTLSANKTVYKTGELPRFTVSIVNKSKSNIYLISALDGSDVQWRFPHCYFTIEAPKPNDTPFGRCGVMNPLQAEDFVLVKVGQTFNPYQLPNCAGSFSSYFVSNPETFKQPGVYKCRFYYSTNTDNDDKFMGTSSYSNNKDAPLIDSLLKKTPRLDLVSNEIKITVEK
jgi:hypothetical protein